MTMIREEDDCRVRGHIIGATSAADTAVTSEPLSTIYPYPDYNPQTPVYPQPEPYTIPPIPTENEMIFTSYPNGSILRELERIRDQILDRIDGEDTGLRSTFMITKLWSPGENPLGPTVELILNDLTLEQAENTFDEFLAQRAEENPDVVVEYTLSEVVSQAKVRPAVATIER